MISRQTQASDVVHPRFQNAVQCLSECGDVRFDVFEFIRAAVNNDYWKRQAGEILLKRKIPIDGYKHVELR